jgi:ribosomal-protein-alanine N-acetyltransferase
MNRPSLETNRLLLRPFSMADAPRVQLLAGDRAIADTTLNIPHPYEDGMAEQWIGTHEERFRKGELVNFAIILKETNQLIGAIGLLINKRFNRAEMGYWIGKDYWNKGYCTEAAAKVLEYGFTKMKLNKIHASHMSRNTSSGRVMARIGMKKEGKLKEQVIKWGKYEDLEIYGITQKEWRKLTKSSG